MPWVPVAPSTNVRKVVSFALLFATAVTFVASVAVSAFPVTSPVNAPENFIAVSCPDDGL